MQIEADDALLVIDVQQDFLPGGALAVPDGHAVIPAINAVAPRFAHIILTQDWHPPGHISFAASHPAQVPFATIDLPYGPQVLWPTHCVQATPGAALAAGLALPSAELIIRKGFHPAIDSYSAFMEADGRTPTGLAGYLRERGLRRLFLAGLATDFCVAWTARDARTAGFAVTILENCCRAIDLNGSLATAWQQMHAAGVTRQTIPSGG